MEKNCNGPVRSQDWGTFLTASAHIDRLSPKKKTKEKKGKEKEKVGGYAVFTSK